MICHHCPGKSFTNELKPPLTTYNQWTLLIRRRNEFQEHCAKHSEAQIRLRRKPRTYGARTTYDSASDVTIPSSGPILPVVSEATQGSLPLSTLSTNTRHEGEAHQSNETQTQDLALAKLNKNDELYGMVARFMSQDKSYVFFRRFSTLNIQNLLHLQSEILQLEKDLHQAERDDNTPVASINESISEKLHQYNAALLQYSQILALRKPESISVSDVRRWISDVTKGEPAGGDFLADEVDPDLASLDGNQTARNRAYRLVEDLIWRLFTTEKTGGKKVQLPKGGTLHIFDDQMIHMAFRAIITLLTFLMLLTPIVALSFMEGKQERLAVIVMCTAITATVMAVATNCREHEIMMAASTYAAVLMIYMN